MLCEVKRKSIVVVKVVSNLKVHFVVFLFSLLVGKQNRTRPHTAAANERPRWLWLVTHTQEIFQDADVMYGENIPPPSSSLLSSYSAAGGSAMVVVGASSSLLLVVMIYCGSELLAGFYWELYRG